MGREMPGLVIRFSSALILILCGLSVAGADHWINTYGTPGYDSVFEIEETSDDGFIVVGSTGLLTFGNEAARVFKLNSSGRIEWQKMLKKAYNGAFASTAQSVQQTSDGGYIVAGVIYDPDDGSKVDAWVVKLNANGNVLWEKAYNIIYWELHSHIRQTQDGGYIMAVLSWSGVYSYQSSILRLDGNGNVLWLKRIRDVDLLHLNDIQQSSDGNYIAVGLAFKSDTGVYGPLAIKLDANGDILWQKIYTTSTTDFISIKQTSDGGYIVVSGITWFGGDVDFVVLKLDNYGQILWQKNFGGRDWGNGSDIHPTSDGGFIIAGSTGSPDENDSGAWIAKLDASGLIEWQKKFDGSKYDAARSIKQTSDGGYIVAGVTESIGEGSQDIWILKLDENGSIPDCSLVSPSNLEFSPASITVSDFNASAVDKAVIPQSVSSDAEETQIQARAWCWRKWEGRFDGLDWLKRAMVCLEWPSKVGVGIPQRCPPGSPCIFCRYNLSKYAQAEKIPEFLLNIYEDIVPILNGWIYRDDIKNSLYQIEKHFLEAPTGEFYTQNMKASTVKKMKGLKGISPQLRGKLVEAINALELDLIAPHQSSAELKAGKYVAADFNGVASVAMNYIEKSGTATLKIRHGLPASAKGMQPAWPIFSYDFDFTGALAKNGYLDISFYIGGINLAGSVSETRLLQWDGKRYTDITSHVDAARRSITGRTNQLSAYVIMSGRKNFSSNPNCFRP
jgi:hypothetical protein